MPIDFRTLIANSPNAYVVLDRDLRIVWMNEAYLRTTMRRRDDVLDRPMFEAFPSDPESESHRLLEGSLQRVLETGEADELALIRYDIHNRDGSMDMRFWSATHTPLLNEAGETAYILQHTVDVTELHGLRRLRDEMGIVRRATAVQARNQDLLEESEQLKTLFEQAPGFVAVLSGPQYEFRLVNQAYRRLVGQRDIVGRPLAEALPEIVRQGFIDVLDRVRATGTAYEGRSERVLLENDGEGITGERYLDFIYQPIFGDDGTVTGIFVQGYDVSEQVAAQDQQRLLLEELNHRVKNTLAVVQSLAAQSFKNVAGADDARSRFDARLNALAAAHGLLTAQSWKTARLRDTIRSSIEATAGSDIERVRLAGPDIDLDPQPTLSMAMLVHELSTNAIKYGALSRAGGRVEVDWTLDEMEDHHRLTIEWRESGGPAVVEPTRQGFGTRLIRRGISTGVDSDVVLRFPPEGVQCTITAQLPLTRP